MFEIMNPEHAACSYQRTVLAISNKEIICLQESDSLRSLGRLGGLSFAFSVKGVINDKFAFENLMIAQTEPAETLRKPSPAGWGLVGCESAACTISPSKSSAGSLRLYFFRIELNETSSS